RCLSWRIRQTTRSPCNPGSYLRRLSWRRKGSYMKKRLVILLLGVATSLIAWPIAAKADIAFSAGLEIRSPADFYEPLTPYGGWVEVRSYGRCWHPARVAAGWRPYGIGHWEWTDCGWYWVSDEPWAWACYHYGSWVYDP